MIYFLCRYEFFPHLVASLVDGCCIHFLLGILVKKKLRCSENCLQDKQRKLRSQALERTK